MSSPIALVEGFLDAFNRHDLDAVLDALAVDVYFVPVGDELTPMSGDFSRHSGFSRWWESEADHLHLLSVTTEQLDENHVFTELQAGTAGDGCWSSVARACICTISDEHIQAIELFTDVDLTYERSHRSVHD
jgi:limonene-1,2-epoxide hydrolase